MRIPILAVPAILAFKALQRVLGFLRSSLLHKVTCQRSWSRRRHWSSRSSQGPGSCQSRSLPWHCADADPFEEDKHIIYICTGKDRSLYLTAFSHPRSWLPSATRASNQGKMSRRRFLFSICSTRGSAGHAARTFCKSVLMKSSEQSRSIRLPMTLLLRKRR